MGIFNLYIFSKRGACLYYTEWHRPVSALRDAGEGEDAKLMFGLLLSLKQLMNKMSPLPVPQGAPSAAEANGLLPGYGPDQGFFRFSTDTYSLFHLEVPTGLKFVVTCDAAAGDLRPALWTLYDQIFTAFALRNPCYVPGSTIENVGFVSAVDSFFRSLPGFVTTAAAR